MTKLSFHHKLVMTISVCAAMFFCMTVLQFLLCDSELSAIKGIGGEEVGKPLPRAVHGMGMVFSRGRKGMRELIVAHMTEGVRDSELRIFVRTLYRSGALARADLVILFPANSLSQSAINVVQDECDLGAKKLSSCSSNVTVSNSVSFFNRAAFEEAAEELKERKRADSAIGAGSVMGFEMEELDPYNLLDAFVEDPPPQLRRWVCYQLLLGRLRHKYTTILLARIGSVVILGDVLASLRKNNANALLLLMESRSWDIPAAEFFNTTHHHRKKLKAPPKSPPHPRRANKQVVEAVYGVDAWRSLSGEERRRKLISSGIIAGSMRAVRALSAAMVNEIVGIGQRHRHGQRAPFPDQVALSYMVYRSSVVARKVTDAVLLIDNGRMPTFAYSVAGTNRTLMEIVGHAAIDGLHEGRRFSSFAEIVHGDICKSPDDGIVYPDCDQPSSH